MLTQAEIDKAKPKEKEYTLSDGNGLYLVVKPSGGKSWIARIYNRNKEIRRGLGSANEISVKEARRRAQKIRDEETASKWEEPLFSYVAKQWLEDYIIPTKKPYYVKNIKLRLNKYILPCFGSLRLSNITPKMVIDCVNRVKALGFDETANRIRIHISQIFDYADILGLSQYNPAAKVAKIINATGRKEEKHHPILKGAEEIGEYMRRVRKYRYPTVRNLLLFSMLTACRPASARTVEWCDIDLKTGVWVCPANKMKMKEPHTYYLSRQAVELLKEQKALCLSETYVFPSSVRPDCPVSADTPRQAIRDTGYTKEQFVPHSVRGTASTVLNEYLFPPDIIEYLLAHGQKNKIRAAYNHATYDRLAPKITQWWADYLTAAENNTTIPPKPEMTITL